MFIKKHNYLNSKYVPFIQRKVIKGFFNLKVKAYIFIGKKINSGWFQKQRITRQKTNDYK